MTASDLFHMFTQSIKFYTILLPRIKEYVNKELGNVIHQIGSKNEWLLLSAGITAKFGLVFILTVETLFLRGSILKPTERA